MVQSNEFKLKKNQHLLFSFLFLLLSAECGSLQAAEFAYGYENTADDFSIAIINVSYVDPSSGQLHNQREEIGKYGRIGTVSGVVVHILLTPPPPIQNGTKFSVSETVRFNPNNNNNEANRLHSSTTTISSVLQTNDSIIPSTTTESLNINTTDLNNLETTTTSTFNSINPITTQSAQKRIPIIACEPIPPHLWPKERWIALVSLGGNKCSEAKKLHLIAQTNASAVILYDVQASTSGQIMRHRLRPGRGSNIISVYISKEKGEEVAALVDSGTRVTMHVQVAAGHFRYATINKTSILFVSISFAILMIISLAWLIFYYIQRFRYIHAKDILTKRLRNAAKKALEKVPTKTLRSTDVQPYVKPEQADCCAVCIEQFRAGDLVRVLPCKHTFHKSCVDPWLLEQRSCPMCKLDILKHYGFTCEMNSTESMINVEEIGRQIQTHSFSHHNDSHLNVLSNQRYGRSLSLFSTRSFESTSNSSSRRSSATSRWSAGPFRPSTRRVAPCPVATPTIITNVGVDALIQNNPNGSNYQSSSHQLRHQAQQSNQLIRQSSAPASSTSSTTTTVSLPSTPSRCLTANTRSFKHTSGECTPTEIQLSVHTLPNSTDA